MMKRILLTITLAAAPVAAQPRAPATPHAHAVPTAAHTAATAAPRADRARNPVDPRADAALRRMSEYLTGLQTFRVNSTAVDEVVDRSGRKLQFISSSRVTMRRPNMVLSERVGPASSLVFRYNGQEFSLYGQRNGYYATAPAPASLDEAVNQLRGRYGLDVPGADLLAERPYDGLMEDTTSGEYIGLEPIDGVPCHHLAYRGRQVDWQIWIQDGAQPLPRRYVITSTHVTGQPEFAVDLSGWEPNATADAASFTLRPPPGSTRIELLGAPPPAAGRGTERRAQ